MDIEVRTDDHVKGDAALTAFVQEEVAAALEPYLTRLTSVQVHLAEESGARRGAPELRCTIAARPARRRAVVVTRHAAAEDDVIRAALSGTRSSLDRLFGRVTDRRRTGAA